MSTAVVGIARARIAGSDRQAGRFVEAVADDVPNDTEAGRVSGQFTMPDARCSREDVPHRPARARDGGARFFAHEALVQQRLRETVVRQQSRPDPARPRSRGTTNSDRMPLFGGYFPVAAAVHDRLGLWGRSVASSGSAPRSISLPKFGSCVRARAAR
jgi:hypothetical protein